MKIQKVKIKDFKVIKDLEKEINGGNILLLGDNGVGKSSFIQFIEIALGKQTEIPIGAEREGLVIADKDGKEWTFSVEFKKGKPVVTVISPDGFKDSRKSVLASVVGAMEFDIDEFVSLSDTAAGRKKQVEIYKSFLPKDIQNFISDQEYRVERSYNERTEVNREAKLLEGYLAEHPFKKLIDVPEQVIDLTQLQKQISDAMAHNDKVKGAVLRQEQRAKDISDIQYQIKQLQEKEAELTKLSKEANVWISENPEIDIKDLMSQKDNAVEINTAFEKKEDYNKQLKQLESLKNQSGELTAFIESSRQVIEDAIKDCEVPVEGLTFDSENLIYNGVPVSNSNLSSSEIMHLGCKLKMAENPDLGILFIQRGESLGAQRLKEIQEMAKKYDWQIIMEQVDRGKNQLAIEIMS